MTKPVAFIFAHPDDESFLCAAFIRRLADEGNRPILLLATKGDAGGKNGAYSQATREQLGAVREKEMEQAAALLGIDSVTHLNYPDGKLNEVDEEEASERIADFLNQHKSQVVVTFPEDGLNRHPDHMAISKLVTKTVKAGKCSAVQRLYNLVRPSGHQEEPAADLRLDTEPIWEIKEAALRAHDSQILAVRRYFGDLEQFPEERRYEALRLAWERGSQDTSHAGVWLTAGLEIE